MTLRYSDETKDRLRRWRESDPTLYQAAERELNAISANPTQHGTDGTPFVPRLVTFSVNGRDEEYVITWECSPDDIAFIGNVSSVTEMMQRSRLSR
ncbi:hypothetical protein ACI3KS_12270 [Microbacterium sp. ZW T5_45]|uniref:hypothetical protein n=1 Tax=Microbacterium sp. ZW T5_45 TaxID=3378080 RepID=UPI00385185A1